MSQRKVFILLVVLYLLGGFVFLPWFKYQLNPDGISYISIAQKYHRGEFYDAVNAYWSPLFSWLLAPIPLATFNVPIRVKTFNIAIGAFILWGFWRLLRETEVKEKYRYLLTATAIPIIWYQTLMFITPDFLLAGIIVWYLGVRLPLFEKKYTTKSIILIGCFGALLYYCKTFGLTWFLVFEFLLNWLEARRSGRYILSIRKYLATIVITFLCILPWILMLHAKYGYWTLGKAPLYTYGMFGPSKPLMMIESGPHAPPNATAVSGWEDPTSHSFPKWSPLGSTTEFIYQGELILANLKETYNSFINFSLFSLVIFLVPFALQAQKSKLKDENTTKILLLAVFVLTLGYLPVRTEERYLWAVPFLALIIVFNFWQKWKYKMKDLASELYSLLLIVIVFSFALMPIFWMYKTRETSKQFYILSQELAAIPEVQGASFASSNNWGPSLYSAFFLDGKYYMQMGLEHTHEEAFEKLASLGVRHYWVWDEEVLPNRELVWKNERLCIYRVSK